LGIPLKQSWQLSQKLSSILPPQIKKRGKLKIPDHLGRLSLSHLKYLRGRGFDPIKLTKLWNLQAMGDRIWIPIRFRGEVVSWTSRSIHDDYGLRYISADKSEESIPHKEILYGLDFVRNAAIIVEGPADVWNIGPGAIATFGTSFTHKQLEVISKIPIRAIWFDAEIKAQQQAKQLMNSLGVMPGDTFLVTPDNDSVDPGSTDKSTINFLRKEIFGEESADRS
jgi:hypothetical protein